MSIPIISALRFQQIGLVRPQDKPQVQTTEPNKPQVSGSSFKKAAESLEVTPKMATSAILAIRQPTSPWFSDLSPAQVLEKFFDSQRFKGIEGRGFIRTYGPSAVNAIETSTDSSLGNRRVAAKIRRYLGELNEDAIKADRWIETVIYDQENIWEVRDHLRSENYGVILDIAGSLNNDDLEVRQAALELLTNYLPGDFSILPARRIVEIEIPEKLARELAPILLAKPTPYGSFSAQEVYQHLIPQEIRDELAPTDPPEDG